MSRNHRQGVGDYRGRLERSGEPKRCIDIGRGLGRCEGPLQADHVQELADNGPKDWTVWRCREHHRRKSAERAAERRARRSEGIPMDERPDRAWARKTIGAGLLAAAGLWLFDRTGYALLAVAATVALVVLGWRSQSQSARRDAVVARLVEALARETNTIHERLRLVRLGWDGDTPTSGMVRYSPVFADGDPAQRAKVEALLERKIGIPLRFDWMPSKDTVAWRPGTGQAPAPEPVKAGPTSTERALGNLTVSLRDFMRSDEVEVRLAGEVDEVGPTVLEVTYPAKFADGSEAARVEVVRRVSAKVPGRWRAEWDTHGNRVRLERRPSMPKSVTHPVFEDLDRWRIPLGVDEDGDTVWWDLRVTPHLIMSGSTGGGKTVALSGVIVECARRGFQIRIIDGKGTALAGFRTWPGVVDSGLGEAESMSAAMLRAEAIMRDRYEQVREQGKDPEDFEPILVVLDEAAEFAINVARWWKSVGKKEAESSASDAPALDAWSSIARLGRECGVHLVLGIQQASVKFLGSTEVRDNFAARLALGPTSEQSSRMMFGTADVGRDVPKDPKGRATVDMDGKIREMQVYWTPAPKPSGEIRPEHRKILDPLRPERPALAPRDPQPVRAVAADPLPLPAAEPEPAPAPSRAPRAAKVKQPGSPVWWDRIRAGDQVLVEAGEREVTEIVEDPADEAYVQVTLRDADGTEVVESYCAEDTVRRLPTPAKA